MHANAGPSICIFPTCTQRFSHPPVAPGCQLGMRHSFRDIWNDLKEGREPRKSRELDVDGSKSSCGDSDMPRCKSDIFTVIEEWPNVVQVANQFVDGVT